MTFGVLVLELIGVYLLSRWVTQSLYGLFYVIFKTRSVGVSLVTLLLFPGTVIHELSHLFVAEILGVRTGKLSLVPESIQSEDIQTGSVAIAKTGPFRRAFIGLAPLVVGIIALGVLSSLYSSQFVNSNLITSIYYYILFAISTSMFPSSVDLRGVWQLMLTILIVIVAAATAGFRIVLPQTAPTFITDLITNLTGSLGIVLAVNAALLTLTTILRRVIRTVQ